MLCAFYQEAIHAHAVEEGVEGLGEGLKTLHVQCSHSAYEDKAKHTHTHRPIRTGGRGVPIFF